MKLAKSLWFQFGISTVSYLYITSSPSVAQITSDGTVNTQVNQNGNVAEITQGETRGSNLFHSFQDFSVTTGNEAFFNNANDISNIFSRVTGGNISNIDGLIRANGSANLFLINPAGIVFGEGASLDIGGSFYGSSASSILFEGGEFSAADLDNPPLLTVNAPIGLGFRDNPGDIVNRSIAQDSTGDIVGLEVLPNQTLALLGGNINLEGGYLTARGGNVQLSGLFLAETINFAENGIFSFPENIELADINLSNAADINVTGAGNGNIFVNASNLSLIIGELGSSVIRAGISADSTSAEAQAGDITVNVAENIILDDSAIQNIVAGGGIGNAGNIIINTNFLRATNGGQVIASTLGEGNAGTIDITASGITLDGEGADSFPSNIVSQVFFDAVGNSGGIKISTTGLSLMDGGSIGSSTFSQGNAGAINITAAGDIAIDGEGSLGFPSGITGGVTSSAVGDAQGITISSTNFSLTNGGRVGASTFSQGNAGAIDITATGNITVDGEDSNGFSSGVSNRVNPNALGDGGGVTISTANLSLTNGGRIDTSTVGQGNAGAINIIATDNIMVDGENSQGFPSNVASQVFPGAVGDAGGVIISTTNLSLTDNGTIDVSSLGEGSAGNIIIDADNINLSDLGNIETTTQSPTGVSGIINLEVAENIILGNDSSISAQAFDEANGGNINIDTGFIIAFLNGNNDIIASAEGGNGGNINISAESLFGIEERPLNSSTNDINASSEFSLDGNITITTLSIDPLQGATELPNNVVKVEQSIQQACRPSQGSATRNVLNITGKGGVVPSPTLPLNSLNVTVEGKNDLTANIPAPIVTSIGKIQPARGIRVNESGMVSLTAYRTNSSGERLKSDFVNCDRM